MKERQPQPRRSSLGRSLGMHLVSGLGMHFVLGSGMHSVAKVRVEVPCL